MGHIKPGLPTINAPCSRMNDRNLFLFTTLLPVRSLVRDCRIRRHGFPANLLPSIGRPRGHVIWRTPHRAGRIWSRTHPVRPRNTPSVPNGRGPEPAFGTAALESREFDFPQVRASAFPIGTSTGTTSLLQKAAPLGLHSPIMQASSFEDPYMDQGRRTRRKQGAWPAPLLKVAVFRAEYRFEHVPHCKK